MEKKLFGVTAISWFSNFPKNSYIVVHILSYHIYIYSHGIWHIPYYMESYSNTPKVLTDISESNENRFFDMAEWKMNIYSFFIQS